MNCHLVAVLFFAGFILTASCQKKRGSDPATVPTDSFSVVVHNGYGSGRYKAGDTIHVFSKNYPENELFDKWSGNISILNDPDEWHTWFIMPDKDVNLTGSIKNITPFTLHFERIMGRERMKPVYYYFPVGYKGIVYLLHGTNGSAADLAGAFEWQQLIKDLVNDKFAVIVTEAEEATTGIDANGDGKLRWQLLPADSVANVDYANIRIITDTLYNRGIADWSKPRYSIGMSDGGFFSAALSYLYHFKGSVQYCSQGPANLMGGTTIPTQFCMAANDDNPSVGAAGNAAALSYSNVLNNKGVCSRYYVNERSPLYPERFARSGAITTAQSVAVFNELRSKGYIDHKNYFMGDPDSFTKAYLSNPAAFPVISSLNSFQTVLGQINISAAGHHIYSDYDRAILKFLNTPCR